MTNATVVTIDGQEYDLDIAKAINDKYLTPRRMKVDCFTVGDVFVFSAKSGMSPIVIMSAGYGTKMYWMGGLHGNPITHWAGGNKTTEEMLGLINRYNGVLKGNISKEVSGVLSALLGKE
jgi:hypothetical protein